MNLRDYFAAHIAQGLLANGSTWNHNDLAKYSFAAADAMIAEREQRDEVVELTEELDNFGFQKEI